MLSAYLNRKINFVSYLNLYIISVFMKILILKDIKKYHKSVNYKQMALNVCFKSYFYFRTLNFILNVIHDKKLFYDKKVHN